MQPERGTNDWVLAHRNGYKAAVETGFYSDDLRPGESETVPRREAPPAPQLTRHEKIGLRYARMRSHGAWTEDMYACVSPAVNSDGSLAGWVGGYLARLDDAA